ncbi:MAG: ethanolamine utilization protein EutJ [Clostridiaceae bacterium]
MLEEANNLIKKMEETMNKDDKINADCEMKVGVDLGTSHIVITVLDKENNPICGEMYRASAVKDGIVVDYLNAVDIVSKLKSKIEKRLGIELKYAATAIPPGISEGNIKVMKNVVEGAGFEVNNIVDEPTAAAHILGIRDGAIVDIGGGTTGISILKNGNVIYTADEPTGGTHLSLVLAGYHRISFEEAENLKRKNEKHHEILPIVKPVLEKVGSIVNQCINGHNVDIIYLVGGTCCLKDCEKIIEKYTGIKCVKPENPLLVTPMGIAMDSRL